MKFSNPKTHPSSVHSRMVESSSPAMSDRFTTGAKKQLPNHNPKQPHLNLPIGKHTHSDARGAAMGANGQPGPAMTYTGMARKVPAAASTPKSQANRNVRKVSTGAAVRREMPKSGANKDY